MYSDNISVQLLIAVLKEYNVKNIVMSPGGSDIPIIHSIENDDFFKCYSVIDERSAVYFGIGVSQVKNEPVACICTSGTAATNYLPGMTEAYYQNVPIIAITADKNPYFQGQIETQKIEQHNLFQNVSKKSVTLPLCKTKDEIWYCERLLKESIIASYHHGKGPVHINIPIVGSYANYDVKTLPAIKKINVVTTLNDKSTWNKYFDIFENAKKILIVVGQNITFSNDDASNIESFFNKYNCAISVEHSSNLKCEGTLFTYPVTEIKNANDNNLIPDIVISMGNNVVSYGLKPILRRNYSKFKHISIDEGGRIRDVFKGLTDVFECTPAYFFEYYSNNPKPNLKNNKTYYNAWLDKILNIKIPDFEFSNFYVAQKISALIPENSIVHLAILNSARVMQFFELKKNIKVFVNAGALGIDGCLSTLVGHSASTDELVIGVIGDLSFFYDMNAAGIKHVDKNLRIILLNNGGGSEFHFFNNKKDIPTLDINICAKHKNKARGWVESLGYDYYSAKNKEELNNALETFMSIDNSPKFLEVFTDMEDDANITRTFYQDNKEEEPLINKMKGFASKVKRKIT